MPRGGPVALERDGHRLVASWVMDGAERVFVSTSPDDPGAREVAVDESGRLALEGLDADTPYYVHLITGSAHLVAGERLVALEGTRNFRDVGGYRCSLGRVRWGRVFRSDGLHRLTGGDRRYLEKLGVRLVCDLRGVGEAEAEPSRLPADGVERRHIPIEPTVGDGPSIDDLIRAGEIDSLVVQDVVGFYLEGLLADPGAPAAALGALAGGISRGSAVVHCTAGKDRTGLVVALLLSLLGVSDDDVVFDHELTNRYRTPGRLEELRSELEPRGIDIDRFRPYFVPSGEVLMGTLETLRRLHGSVERFLTGAGGLAPEAIDELRRRLVLPDAVAGRVDAGSDPGDHGAPDGLPTPDQARHSGRMTHPVALDGGPSGADPDRGGPGTQREAVPS